MVVLNRFGLHHLGPSQQLTFHNNNNSLLPLLKYQHPKVTAMTTTMTSIRLKRQLNVKENFVVVAVNVVASRPKLCLNANVVLIRTALLSMMVEVFRPLAQLLSGALPIRLAILFVAPSSFVAFELVAFAFAIFPASCHHQNFS
jgi:hypothetical protein